MWCFVRRTLGFCCVPLLGGCVGAVVVQQLLDHCGPGVGDGPLVVYIRSIMLRRCMLYAHGPGYGPSSG